MRWAELRAERAEQRCVSFEAEVHKLQSRLEDARAARMHQEQSESFILVIADRPQGRPTSQQLRAPKLSTSRLGGATLDGDVVVDEFEDVDDVSAEDDLIDVDAVEDVDDVDDVKM